MSLIDLLCDERAWLDFLAYKKEHHISSWREKELSEFIEKREYESVCREIESGGFPLPKKAVISKQNSTKKRIVYTYPSSENLVLKLLTHLILRKYDHLFYSGLYSFRPGRGAKDAVRRFARDRRIEKMYSYKVDISDYFNSVDIPLLLPMLDAAMADDPELLSFCKRLLCEKCVLEKGEPIEERKGIMAGTPLSSFYANLFLCELDRYFYENRIPYARYSDDVIVFAETREKCNEYAEFIKAFLDKMHLSVNPEKEFFAKAGEEWTFLGFVFSGGVVDIAPASVKKLKMKMRRKARALARWAKRKGLPGEKAAIAFIRAFNRKLFDNQTDTDLTWARWFFPVINTSESLRIIDNYAQDCIRFLMCETRTKARFNARYEDIKKLGYKSLVHEFYSFDDEAFAASASAESAPIDASLR